MSATRPTRAAASLSSSSHFPAIVGSKLLKPVVLLAKSSPVPQGVTNTKALGHILYTDYVYAFQIAGMVLLVAMIGAIVLTLRSRLGVRRQNISVQNARTAAMAVDMLDVKPGEGA